MGFVGMPASGKTEAAKVLQCHGIPIIRMGDVVRAEVKARGLDITEENVGRVADELRKNEGMDAVAKRCISLISKTPPSNCDTVVIDGIRGIAEVKAYEKAFGNRFILIAIEASQKIRFNRAMARKREDDVSNWESFKQKDERELRWGLTEAMNIADISLDNDGTLEEFKKQAKSILGGI
ncbi:MAG: AAA family ATPase [Methanosarcinales archaeon Met12]|nr:MAG: AAA family ATPase [Methanosarcinales archaeon Met12]